jgi:D-alanyl-lipoteichoic acid acyltransferase DltB (MBOAT superfamily)
MSTIFNAIDTNILTGLAVAIAFSIAVPTLSLSRRSRSLCLTSVIGAAAYYWQEFAGFVVVNGIAYAALRWLSHQAIPSKRWRRACGALFFLVAVFTLGRVFQWDRWLILPGQVPIVLYSFTMWSALRLVTLFWEVGAGTTAAPPLSGYITWTCLPLTLGGPILRYSQMAEATRLNLGSWTSPGCWMEVVTGAAKLSAGIALGAAQRVMSSHWPQAHLWNNITQTLLTGPIGFYLTTAGYLHLMEALGRPSGFRLPMSFNCPIGRENISRFWMNWNMTATHVFRDYLFFNRWGLTTYNVYLNTLVLFTLVGLWHAANAYWILWGFLHGLLFCCFLVWRKYGTQLERIPLRGTIAARTAARVLTYISVCACWYLPSKLLQRLGST